MTMLGLFGAGPASAEESTKVDCRFEEVGTVHSHNSDSSPFEPLPENDGFRSLWADPKQPQFFASWQGTRVRSNNTYPNLGSVGLGDNFGLPGRRNGCNGWQIGILAGVFVQFNLDSGSTDLINADYVVGIPVSWRSGLVSTRVRLYHRSSHRVAISAMNFCWAIPVSVGEPQFRGGRGDPVPRYARWVGRVYAGGTYLVYREPATIRQERRAVGIRVAGANHRGANIVNTPAPSFALPRCSERTL